MGRRRLVLNQLDLGTSTATEDFDKAEEIANRILDMFDLEVSDDQFEVMCEIIEETALNKHGDLKDHRSLAVIAVQVGQAKVPDDVRAAMLLVLLKDRFKRLRTRMAEVAARPENTEENTPPGR